jgi:hypothetical protein
VQALNPRLPAMNFIQSLNFLEIVLIGVMRGLQHSIQTGYPKEFSHLIWFF